jgi:stage III sporulation protein AB
MILKQKKKYGGSKMLKIIGCIVILAASSAAGFIYGEGFKKRVIDLRELQRIIHLLQSEIEYKCNPIPRALKELSSKTMEPFSIIFNEISQSLAKNEVESVYEAFKNIFNNSNHRTSLNKDDIDILLDLSKSLGESDVSGQRKMFELSLESIKKQIILAEGLMYKNLKVYRYLGVTLGSMIIIMLI